MSIRALQDTAWEYPRSHKNQLHITELMSFLHGRVDDPYPRNKTFSKEELLELVPSDIKKYLLFKAFLDPDPAPNARAINARAGSLWKAKQGISFFMPNHGVAWIDGVGGNPTRHSSVSAVIRHVEDLEVKGLGVDPNDKRAYREAEFDKVLELFREQPDFNSRMKYPLMTLWACHLIHHLDDSCHFKVNDPHGNVDFPFTLKTRTRWSKNVRTLKNCPDQILLASDDWRTCVILWFAIYLEAWLTEHPTVKFLFTTNPDIKNGPKNLNQQCGKRIDKVAWSQQSFKDLHDETGEDAAKGVGTHSNRKCTSTKAKRRGAKETQVEYRGRWAGEKGQRIVSRVHISMDDPHTDAFVAGLLCNGGPIKCESKEGFAITDNWLFVECVPSIRRRFPNDSRMCRVLGLAMLHAVFDVNVSEFLPAIDVDRIRTNFVRVHGEVDGNPVIKVPLRILGNDGDLDIVEVRQGEQQQQQQQQQQQGQQQHHQTTDPAATIAYMQRMERNMKQELRAIRSEQTAARAWMKEQFDRVVSNQRRFGGTIGQALARQHQGRQARNRQHAAAQAQQQRQRQQEQQV